MRSFLLVLASVVVIVSLYLGYSALQSGTTHQINGRTGADPLPAPPQKGQPWTPIKPGQHVWVSAYGSAPDYPLKNRFRADDYTPQPNGKINVTNPVAEFYTGKNQMMRLIGKTGEVTMPESSPAPQGSNEFISGSPTRGRIEDVTIQLFNMLPGSLPGVPDETITTRDIEFDNATRLITTETEDGVPADQIPVHMRSDPDHLRPDSDHRGYDFDGRGMRMRWNDKDGRLDLLEIAHGEQLIVKDTSSTGGLMGGGGHKANPGVEARGNSEHREAPTPAVALDGNASAGVHPVVSALTGILDSGSQAKSPTATRAVTAATAPAVNGKDTPPIPIPYVATFYDNVRITQGDEALVTADRMDVDFISRQNQENKPATVPATNQSTSTGSDAQANAGAVADANSPTTAPASTQPAGSQVAAGPTTKPASAPVVIRWTGKLVMLSEKKDRPKVAPGDAIVELTGEPVMVRRTPAGQTEGDDVRAGKLFYHTADGSVKLLNSKATPQVVISKLLNGKIDPQSTVTTDTLDYVTDATGKKVAILTGPGHAMMPMATEQPRAQGANAAVPAMMDTHWQSGAKVFFLEKGGDELAVDHVELNGDVDVKHPQLALKSQALSLYFDAPTKHARRPTTQPTTGSEDGAIIASAPTTRPAEKPQQELKRVVASRAVHCVLAGQNGKLQTIDSSELEMLTAQSEEGKFYARQVNAGGAVHAFDGEQDLRADSIALTLKPVNPLEKKLSDAAKAASDIPVAQTQPAKEESDTAAVELEKMVARDNVLVTNKDRSTASGAELVVTTEDHQNHVRLTGAPSAIVIDAKKNTIIGPVITFEQGIAHVIGNGSMHLLQEQQGQTTPRPMEVTWINRADMNGPANRVDLTGAVAVTTHDADGTVNVARGDRVHIDLIDKAAPTMQPTTNPATTKPAHKDATADSAQMGVMKDKEARRITLDGNGEVVSKLTDANGIIVRQFALFGPKIIYQLAEDKELPAKTLWVPSAGRMYVGDHRPPEAPKPGDKPKAKGDDDDGGKGDTAFQWSQQLIYRELQRTATLVGNVDVVHQPLGEQAEDKKVRINADRVTAWFEPQPRVAKPAATQPATQPTTVPATRPAQAADSGESLQLKHLTADGHTVVTRPATGATLYADRIDFDPLTHWMNAHGTDRNPAQYIDPDPKKKPLTGIEIQWNTETWFGKVIKAKSVDAK